MLRASHTWTLFDLNNLRYWQNSSPSQSRYHHFTPNTPGDLVTPPNAFLPTNTKAILFAYLDGEYHPFSNCSLCLWFLLSNSSGLMQQLHPLKHSSDFPFFQKLVSLDHLSQLHQVLSKERNITYNIATIYECLLKHIFVLLFIFITYFIEGLPGIRYYSRHCECSSEPKRQSSAFTQVTTQVGDGQ